MRRVIGIVVGALRSQSSLLILALIAASATTYVACVGDDSYQYPTDGAADDTKPSNDGNQTTDSPEDTTDDSPVTTH